MREQANEEKHGSQGGRVTREKNRGAKTSEAYHRMGMWGTFYFSVSRLPPKRI